MNTATIASWLLTYLVHSTVLLGAAWLGARFLGDRRLALQETFLRGALIGGLLTATIQVGFGLEPIGGALILDELTTERTTAVSSGITLQVSTGEDAVVANSEISSPRSGMWPAVLVSLWVLGSMMALVVLSRSILDLRRLLETRRFRPTGRLLDRLASAMGLRRSVRLSTSPAIAVPFATGIRQPEICCPERVGDLAHEHQKSLFAHELAHLARRDPAWQLLYRIGEALLFLQPLNRLVRRRLEEIAEHLTDERAVACTGDRLGLARCLVVVAHWGVSNPPGVPATAFAAGPRLDRRVRRLISGAIEQRRSAGWAVPVLVALLLGSVLFLPAFLPPAAHANISETGSEAAPVQPWSKASETPEAPAPPAVPSAPRVTDTSPPPAPVIESVPAASVAPRSAAAPNPPPAPADSVEPAPAAVPEPRSEPAPPRAPEPRSEPTAPDPDSPTPPNPPAPPEKATPAEPAEAERDRARAEARSRQREAHRAHAEAQARAREEARARAAESRERAERAREMAREMADQHRMTEAEREKLRREHHELHRQAQIEARERSRLSREQTRELAERSRELAREAAEKSRLTAEEREELRREARERQAEMQERARELAERARELAEQAEAERRAEEELRQRERVE